MQKYHIGILKNAKSPSHLYQQTGKKDRQENYFNNSPNRVRILFSLNVPTINAKSNPNHPPYPQQRISKTTTPIPYFSMHFLAYLITLRAMRYGVAILGPPGSGKTTFCNGLSQFLSAVGREASVVNLDPANYSHL